MDIAQLGLEVQSGSVKAATNDLNKLTNAAKVAENASKGLSSASGRFDTKQIEQMASQMGAVEKTSAAAARALAAASLASQRAAANGNAQARAIAQTGGQAKQQIGNLAYQIQDIGTMLAMGQSPFMLLAQQLPQVTMHGGSLNGVMGALKQTVAGLLSPLGLVTTGFVLLASVAISYFSEWLSKGGEANRSLEEQEKLIQNVASAWGAAAPRMKAYADELERAVKAKELLDAGEIAAGAQFSPVEDLLKRINAEYITAIRELRGYGDETTTVVKGLTTSFRNLQANILEGKATTEDMTAVQNALSIAVDKYGTPSIIALSEAFKTLVPRLEAAIGAAAGFRAEASGLARIAMFPSQGAYKGVERSPDGRIQGAEFNLPESGPRPTSRPLIELEGTSWIKEKKHRDNPYETATRSVKEQTAALHAQTAAQAALNPLVNDYGFSTAKAKAAQELLSSAQRAATAAGKELKDVQQLLGGDFEKLSPAARKQAEAMLQLASNYAVATEAAEIFKEKQKEIRKRAEDALNAGKNVISGMIDGFIEGEKAADIFANSLKRIGKALVDDVLNSIFKIQNLSGGGGGGGWLSSLFGGLFGGRSQFGIASAGGIGMYADGTASARAGLAMVGEEGPELVRFKGGEKVIPNHQLRGEVSGANDNRGGPTYNIDARTTIQASGNAVTDADLKRWAAQRDAEMPGRIRKVMDDINLRRG